jgi:N-acetylmuramoyl-L-alanine amidase
VAPVTQEWNFNVELARVMAEVLHDRHGITSEIISHYEGAGYSAAMHWLAARLKALNVKAAVELHFNSSANRQARGHEWLYWHASARGRNLANWLSAAYSRAHPLCPARGAKPVENDRGGEFLRRTHCPAVICEPFFGTNATDWNFVRKNVRTIAAAMASGISQSISSPL